MLAILTVEWPVLAERTCKAASDALLIRSLEQIRFLSNKYKVECMKPLLIKSFPITLLKMPIPSMIT